jgi:putative restriction endonuclease
MLSILEQCLARLEPEHARALEWFLEHEGDVGPRPWRVSGASVVPGVQVPLVAQRGIHQPSGWIPALSVTATRGSVYLDGKPERVDSDTWVLPYSAHAGGDGMGLESRWNQALLANWVQRIPVGVFVPHGRTYKNLGLAMVEDYDPRTGTFFLRGPVRYSQSASVWLDSTDDPQDIPSLVAEEAEDPRSMTLVRRRFAQDKFRDSLIVAYSGRCAVTGYDARDALQGAHILAYQGKSSQMVANGLLLRADIHLMFDRHLLSVHPEMHQVRLSPELHRTKYAPLHGAPLHAPERQSDQPDRKRLAVHWAVFERAWR